MIGRVSATMLNEELPGSNEHEVERAGVDLGVVPEPTLVHDAEARADHQDDVQSDDGEAGGAEPMLVHNREARAHPEHEVQLADVEGSVKPNGKSRRRRAQEPSCPERRHPTEQPTHDWQPTREVQPTHAPQPTSRMAFADSTNSNRERQRPRAAQSTHVEQRRAHLEPPLPATVTTARPPRAPQTVPPAVRRYVLHRDHGRCVVPGCAHGSFLDVHHLCARAEGGTHEPDNLVTLCAGHHAALHAGQLSIEGRPSTKLRFRRGDGTSYAEAPSARSVAVSERVIRGLRRLGFSERDSKSVVARVLETMDALCAETLLRTAIATLTRPLC